MFHAFLIDVQSGRHDVRTGYRTVHDLLGCTDRCTDDLGITEIAIMAVDIDDILDIGTAVFTVGFFPANERRNEQAAVLCSPQSL